MITYVTAGEVTTLKHEVRDDSVEGRALVTETLLASAESSEVLGGLGDDVVVELEVDLTSLSCKGENVSFDETIVGLGMRDMKGLEVST